MTEEAVRARFGIPSEVRTDHFLPPSYGRPPLPRGVDKQFIYGANMSHVYIYFRSGVAQLGLEEWSDY